MGYVHSSASRPEQGPRTLAPEWAGLWDLLVDWSDRGFDIAAQSHVPLVVTSGAVVPVVSAAGVGVGTTDGASWNRSPGVAKNGDLTLLMVGAPSTSGTQSYVTQAGSVGELRFGANFDANYDAAPGRIGVTMLEYGVNRSHAGVAGAADGKPHVVVFRKKGTSASIYIDGYARTLITSGGFTGNPLAAADTTNLIGNSGNGAWACPSGAQMIGIANRALPEEVCRSLSESPWQVFRDAPRRIYVPGGGGSSASISAAVVGAGNVSVDISTAISLAAVSLGVGSVTGGIGTAIPVAATVLGAASVAGELSVQIRVAASVLGEALTAASLTTGIPVSVMVSGAGSMSAALSLGATISGQVLGDALVQAGIVTRIEVGAAVAGGGAVQASLGGTPAQVGAAVAGAGLVVGSITTQIPIAAAVLGAALVSGALEVSVPIGAVVQGVGYIQSGIDTAIQAVATVAGGGAVSARVEVAVVRISAPRQVARNTQHAARSRAVQTSRRPRTTWH